MARRRTWIAVLAAAVLACGGCCFSAGGYQCTAQAAPSALPPPGRVVAREATAPEPLRLPEDATLVEGYMARKMGDVSGSQPVQPWQRSVTVSLEITGVVRDPRAPKLQYRLIVFNWLPHTVHVYDPDYGPTLVVADDDDDGRPPRLHLRWEIADIFFVHVTVKPATVALPAGAALYYDGEFGLPPPFSEWLAPIAKPGKGKAKKPPPPERMEVAAEVATWPIALGPKRSPGIPESIDFRDLVPAQALHRSRFEPLELRPYDPDADVDPERAGP